MEKKLNERPCDRKQQPLFTFSRVLCAFLALCFAFLPITPFYAGAASEEGTLWAIGGLPFGVRIRTEGTMVYRVEEGSPAAAAGLLSGDCILSADGREVTSTAEFCDLVANSGGRKIALIVCRAGKTLRLTLKMQKNSERAGVYLRDGLSGIGTLSFYDPESGEFAGLGHGICQSDSAVLLPLREGSISRVRLTELVRGEAGAPGQLRGIFYPGTIGSVTKNTAEGIFGVLSEAPEAPEHRILVKAARPEEVTEGQACIYCTVDGGRKEKYDVVIEKILGSGEGKNYLVRVTDRRLLDAAGGIVQGMSGSPIVQNGKLIGAVTHVLINDPARGYAISAENMLKQMERAENA